MAAGAAESAPHGIDRKIRRISGAISTRPSPRPSPRASVIADPRVSPRASVICDPRPSPRASVLATSGRHMLTVTNPLGDGVRRSSKDSAKTAPPGKSGIRSSFRHNAKNRGSLFALAGRNTLQVAPNNVSGRDIAGDEDGDSESFGDSDSGEFPPGIDRLITTSMDRLDAMLTVKQPKSGHSSRRGSARNDNDMKSSMVPQADGKGAGVVTRGDSKTSLGRSTIVSLPKQCAFDEAGSRRGSKEAVSEEKRSSAGVPQRKATVLGGPGAIIVHRRPSAESSMSRDSTLSSTSPSAFDASPSSSLSRHETPPGLKIFEKHMSVNDKSRDALLKKNRPKEVASITSCVTVVRAGQKFRRNSLKRLSGRQQGTENKLPGLEEDEPASPKESKFEIPARRILENQNTQEQAKEQKRIKKAEKKKAKVQRKSDKQHAKAEKIKKKAMLSKKERKAQKKKKQLEEQKEVEEQRKAFEKHRSERRISFHTRSSMQQNDAVQEAVRKVGDVSKYSARYSQSLLTREVDNLVAATARKAMGFSTEDSDEDEDQDTHSKHSKTAHGTMKDSQSNAAASVATASVAMSRGHIEAKAQKDESHVDKRLLMVRNARLIQQLLHEIPDEATRCHDKWLKRLAHLKAQAKQTESITATKGHRLSVGVKTAEERMENQVKKIGQKLRWRRREELLLRLGRPGQEGTHAASAESDDDGDGERETSRRSHDCQSDDTGTDSETESDSTSSSASSESSSSGSSFCTSSSSSSSSCEDQRSKADACVRRNFPGSGKERLVGGSEVSAPAEATAILAVKALDKDMKRLFTAPAGHRPRQGARESLAYVSESGVEPKTEKESIRPGTTPGGLHQWMDLSSIFLEVARQRELLKEAAAEVQRAWGTNELKVGSESLLRPSMLDFGSLFGGCTSIPITASEGQISASEGPSSKEIASEIPSSNLEADKAEKDSTDSEASDAESSQSSVFSTGISGNAEAIRQADKMLQGQRMGTNLAVLVRSENVRRGKLPEVPRLRSRYHDHRLILRDQWRYCVATMKRHHLDLAEQLGLKAEDWDSGKIYNINIDDLIFAAEEKEQRLLAEAARRVQVSWRILRYARRKRAERKHRMHCIVTIQRWWCKRVAWILPIQRRCAARPIAQRAAIKIAAFIKAWYTHKKFRLEHDCHSIRFRMQKLQEDLGRDEVESWVRVQAHIRGFLERQRHARRSIVRGEIRRRTVALDSGDQEKGNSSSIRKERSPLRRATMQTLCSQPLASSEAPPPPIPHGRSSVTNSAGAPSAARRTSTFMRHPPCSSSSHRRPSVLPSMEQEDETSQPLVPSSRAPHSPPDAPVATLMTYGRPRRNVSGHRVAAAIPMSLQRHQPLEPRLAKLGGLRPA